MCFSVNVNIVKEELEKRYGVDFPYEYRYQPSYYYHAFSLPELPAICSETPDRIEILQWGLIPSWIRNLDDANNIRYKTFNARAETVAVKPSFSGSVSSKRCVVPIRGFFEWQHTGRQKVPWYIYHPDNEILSLAGLYSEWTDRSNGEMHRTFTVITTEANDMMAVIHNSKKRMPALLDREGEKIWTDLSVKPSESLQLLRPCPEDFLKAHIVGPLVSSRNADKNSPEVNRPYDHKTNPGLF